MTRPLSEQSVVITGASSGIGRQAALEFARHGASVTLAARNDTALKDVAEEIRRAGGKAQVVVTDVAIWDQVERLAHGASSNSAGSTPGSTTPRSASTPTSRT